MHPDSGWATVHNIYTIFVSYFKMESLSNSSLLLNFHRPLTTCVEEYPLHNHVQRNVQAIDVERGHYSRSLLYFANTMFTGSYLGVKCGCKSSKCPVWGGLQTDLHSDYDEHMVNDQFGPQLLHYWVVCSFLPIFGFDEQ